MKMDVVAIIGQLVLVSTCLAATQHACADMDSTACHLMEASNPGLCHDISLAEVACPRYCNLCPIQCYHCNTTLKDFHSCTSTKMCAQHEVCMTKTLTSIDDGHHAYQLTCEKKDHCDGGGLTLVFGKRGLEARDVSITCCKTDRCNYPGTNSATTAATTSAPTGTCKKDVTVLMENKERMDLSVRHVTEFLYRLAAKLPIGPNDVHMSFASGDLRSSHMVDPLWKLDTYTDNTSISAAIANIPQLLPRNNDRRDTQLDQSPQAVDLQTYLLSRSSASGRRPDAANILLAITDDGNGGIDSRHLLQDYASHFDHVITIGADEEGRGHGMTVVNGEELEIGDSRHLLDIVDKVADILCPKAT